MTYSKKINDIDVMIFKRFHFTERKPELCNICEKKLLKSNFFSKKKNSKRSFWIYVPALVISSYYITI